MKKLYFCIAFIFVSCFVHAQTPMILTYQVQSEDLTISVPIIDNPGNEGSTNNCTIDFGDGTVLTQGQGQQHTYSAAGTYTVTVSGNFYGFGYADYNSMKMKTVEQWGDNVWQTMYAAFAGYNSLTINTTDAPNLSQVTNMGKAFEGSVLLNQSLNNWDVSHVTDMSEMFAGATSFNQPLDNWDVSNVTTMERMFMGATSFNQPLNNWNVSSLTTTRDMFSDANVFNQPLDNWNVSNVTITAGMFFDDYVFNQPLNSWDVSHVIHTDNMFNHAFAFNQPLNNWNVSSVTSMNGMFREANAFNQPINNWNVSNVTDMGSVFEGAEVFNQPLNDWDVSGATFMAYMLEDMPAFNQPLDNWDVSHVTNMREMFNGDTVFNQPLNNWDVSHVTAFWRMFGSASAFNQPLDNWNVSSGIYFDLMFLDAVAFNSSVANWNFSGAISTADMFSGATSFNQPVSNWNIPIGTDTTEMFFYASSFNQDISNWDISLFSPNILNSSGYDTNNYDILLMKFLQSGVQNGNFVGQGLHYCDYAVHDALTNTFGWTIYGDSLSDDCVVNGITGTVLYDENADGCDPGDVPVSNFLVNAGTEYLDYTSSTGIDGSYQLTLFQNTYALSVLNIPSYYTVTPADSAYTFTTLGSAQALNFCVTANETVQDLNVTLLPLGVARPGFDTHYQLVAQNMGTQTIGSATVSLTFDASLQTFVSASPAATSTTTNQLNFSVSDIQALHSKIIDVTISTLPPPAVVGGELVNFTAAISPDTTDYSPGDNTFALTQETVNSYDPNDKTVLQGDQISLSQADGYLDYIVRFQNTGSASAQTVRVVDNIDPKLDWTTLMPVSGSHDYKVKITNGNKVEFIFTDINLSPEAEDEAESTGFIAYKIKPVQGIQVGDVITGDAQIYFDFNDPIVTNSVSTEIIGNMGVAENLAGKVSVYPNPTTGMLHLQPQAGSDLEEVKVFDLQGSQLLLFKTQLENINVESLSAGIYFITVKTSQGSGKYKLIKI